MNRSVFWALVRKDLYLMRGLMVIAIVVGVLALFAMGYGKLGFAIGGVLFITASMASGIFIASLSILTDRVSQSRLFALSLPISGRQYDAAKLVAVYLVYGIPWSVLTLVAVLAFLLSPVHTVDRGMVVYALMIQGSVLTTFSLMVAWLYVIKTESLIGIGILAINILFTLFMVQVNQPNYTMPLHTASIVWTPYAVTMLSTQVLLILASLVFAVLRIVRRRDHI